MSILDDLNRWERIDPSGMRILLTDFPAQMREAAEAAASLSLPVARRIENIVLAGLGGSAIGGDVIRSVAGDRLGVPFVVSRDYCLPGFAGSATLVIASSYSGNTEETLSAYREARRAGAAIVCVTSGGKLAEMAGNDQFPLVSIPAGLPPRAALGYSTMALLGSLCALGLVAPMRPAMEETVQLLYRLEQKYGLPVPESVNPAKQVARLLHGKIGAIYAASGVLEGAAIRWRGQLEENAKNLALHHLLPEMNHNELVGWDFPASLLRQVAVVLLRDAEEHPQVRRRFDLTREILEQKAGTVYETWSEGESRLARIFSVIYMGDFASLYLAGLNEVDPTPVTVIESLKRRLAQ